MTPPPITTHTLPAFITFTGIDDHTDLQAAAQLASEYPIEYGMLFSQERQGSGRYPSLDLVDRLREVQMAQGNAMPLRLSAHLCGEHARDVRLKGRTKLDDVIHRVFARAQINIRIEDTLWCWQDRLKNWATTVSTQPILQCRDQFPPETAMQWLYDPSGGRGIVSVRWPRPSDPDRLVGFAGGLGPATIHKAVEQIGWLSRRYWLDMESALRDQNDRFDLDVCRKVCEVVYGNVVRRVQSDSLAAPQQTVGHHQEEGMTTS